MIPEKEHGLKSKGRGTLLCFSAVVFKNSSDLTSGPDLSGATSSAGTQVEETKGRFEQVLVYFV